MDSETVHPDHLDTREEWVRHVVRLELLEGESGGPELDADDVGFDPEELMPLPAEPVLALPDVDPVGSERGASNDSPDEDQESGSQCRSQQRSTLFSLGSVVTKSL